MSESAASRFPWLALAGLATLGALGYFAYAEFARRIPRAMQDAVVEHLNARDPRPGTGWLADPSEIGMLSGGQGVPPETVDAVIPDGYVLKRSKLARLDGRLFVQLYLERQGREASLFVRAGEGKPLSGKPDGRAAGRVVYSADFDDAWAGGVVLPGWTVLAAGSDWEETGDLIRFAGAALAQ